MVAVEKIFDACNDGLISMQCNSTFPGLLTLAVLAVVDLPSANPVCLPSTLACLLPSGVSEALCQPGSPQQRGLYEEVGTCPSSHFLSQVMRKVAAV